MQMTRVEQRQKLKELNEQDLNAPYIKTFMKISFHTVGKCKQCKKMDPCIWPWYVQWLTR